ncbi:SDR family NAD(P)-dependent oxidoreductase [Erwinia sp. HR93]|uniref:SDR family NAD(P)-dependent oxidoreductase n=1 Tax=Erwinia sp. HR93 TaxID=3094840 RepID=UPI002ADEBE52|nr:SDR family oxidoreductase [Erwinia sp. HR93]MEA1063026.1 SDR family oxidoreductase [Erwinia sp. HR93]
MQRIVLVTGGSRGLGKNAVLKLAERGIDVIFTWRHGQREAEEVVREVAKRGARAVSLRLDVSDCASFPAFAQDVARLLRATWQRERFDYLLNNAGTGMNTLIAHTSETQFDEMVNIHLKGPFFLTQTLLPLIEDGGRILNVSSGLTRFALPGKAAYAAMKGAVEVFTRYLAKELSERKITANCIAPGAIATDFGDGEVRDNAHIAGHIAAQTALGRVGQPDDIGDAIAALLSDELAWMNAQRVEVSGGMFL